MRNRFNEQLEQLNVELIKMGALCEEAISAATKAYVEGDRELGERARSLEQDIDHKERDIESQCMKLLLRQQPVAKDLRAVSAALIAGGENGGLCLDLLMIAKYFERIGDHACNIAQWVEYAITGDYEDD